MSLWKFSSSCLSDLASETKSNWKFLTEKFLYVVLVCQQESYPIRVEWSSWGKIGCLGFSAVLWSWWMVLAVTNLPGPYHSQCEPAWLGCESSVTSCSLGCLPWQQQWPQCVFMKPPCSFSVIQTPYAMLLASAQLSRKGGEKGGRKQQFSPQ